MRPEIAAVISAAVGGLAEVIGLGGASIWPGRFELALALITDAVGDLRVANAGDLVCDLRLGACVSSGYRGCSGR